MLTVSLLCSIRNKQMNNRFSGIVKRSVPAKNIIIPAFLFAILVVQPILPVLEYYIFKQYIIENLCVNRNKPESCCEGKCFLEKRIKESQTDMPREKQSTGIVKTNRIEYFCQVLWNKLSLPVFAISPTSDNYPGSQYSFDFYHSIFHPPKI